jgi:hypothetical protein
VKTVQAMARLIGMGEGESSLNAEPF